VFSSAYGTYFSLSTTSRSSEGASCLFHAGLLLGLLLDSEDGDDLFLRNVGRLIGLHGVTILKVELYVTLINLRGMVLN
jgi:hypothetical protein